MTVKKEKVNHRHAGRRIVTLLQAAECPVCNLGTKYGSTPWGKQKRRQEPTKPALGEAMYEREERPRVRREDEAGERGGVP